MYGPHISIGYPDKVQQSDLHGRERRQWTISNRVHRLPYCQSDDKIWDRLSTNIRSQVTQASGHFQTQHNGPLPPRTRIGLRNRPCH